MRKTLSSTLYLYFSAFIKCLSSTFLGLSSVIYLHSLYMLVLPRLNNLWFMQKLIDHLDRDLKYAIEVEHKTELEAVTNYDDVKKAIKGQVGPYVSFTLDASTQQSSA